MVDDGRELEKFGDQYVASFEAIRRALSLYPASHPTVRSQLERFLASLAELRERTGDSKVSLVGGEFYVNGLPLKRLSLIHEKVLAAWAERGLELIAYDAGVTGDDVLAFFRVLDAPAEDLAAAGGLDRAVAAAGVRTIRLARVTVGVQADPNATEADVVDAPYPAEEELVLDREQAKARYRDTFGRLLMAIQGAASVDPRVRVIRNLSQIVESRLLERRAVRELANEFKRFDRESYRHALGGAVVSVLIGSALGIEPRRLRLLGEAALLRDIGKLALPLAVLHDRDHDAASTAAYETHPILGARMLLERWEIDPTAAIVAFEHHARLDLKGFPRLGARKSLHAFSRIVAVASDYDRFTGGYPGVASTTVWEAVGKLVRGVFSAYDPAAVRGFLAIVGCVPEGAPVRLLDGREGIVAGLGAHSWLCPRVAILRDAEGREVPPTVIETDGLAPPGESVVEDFSQVTERDLERLEILRDAS